MWDGEVDGVSPKLHLTMHEIIAAQLWADHPPEAWQAAWRLKMRGMSRHEVLHELMGVMAKYIRPTLADGTPFDSAAYRRALAALGIPGSG
jgi:hypothetical protein